MVPFESILSSLAFSLIGTAGADDLRDDGPIILEQLAQVFRARMHAHRHVHQASAVAIDNEGRAVGRPALTLSDFLPHGERLVDEPVHARRLRLEIASR